MSLRPLSPIRLTLATAAFLAVACSRNTSKTVFLGAAAPLSSAVGDANMKGFELALDELNAAPGHSFKFDKVIRDDSAKGDRAAIVAQEFVNDPRVVAV